MKMNWFERTIMWIVIVGMIALFTFTGLYFYNRTGIKTYTGDAVATGCAYKEPWTQVSLIGKTTVIIQHPEEWWLWMRLDNKQASLQVTQHTCQSPVGTVYKVKYGYGRLDGDLIIKGFAH